MGSTTIGFPQGSLLCVDKTDDGCIELLLLGDPDCEPYNIDNEIVYDFYKPCTDDTVPCLAPSVQKCVDDFLAEFMESIEFVGETKVIGLINSIFESKVNEISEQVNKSNCCIKEKLNVYGPNGTQTQVSNILNMQEECHIYTAAPDPAAAQQHYSFNDDGLPNGDIVSDLYAGPDDGKGGVKCLTHRAFKGQWIKLGYLEQESTKCCLYTENNKPTFPINYSAENSVWNIKGEEIKLPICRDVVSADVSNIAAYPGVNSDDVQLMSGALTPDLSSFSSTVGTPESNLTGLPLYIVNNDLWAGNGGNLNPTDVQKVCLTFTADGGDFGFGLVDANGNVSSSGGGGNWIPSDTVTGPGSYVETANQTIVLNTNPGEWTACYTLPGHVLSSNSISPVFYGLGNVEITDVKFEAHTETGNCTIDDWEHLAQILTEASEYVWFESCDNVCAYLPDSVNSEPVAPCGCLYKE